MFENNRGDVLWKDGFLKNMEKYLFVSRFHNEYSVFFSFGLSRKIDSLTKGEVFQYQSLQKVSSRKWVGDFIQAGILLDRVGRSKVGVCGFFCQL